MFFTGNSNLVIPCERFLVTYRLWGTEEDAYAKARDICLEQTVEFPEELVPDGLIKDHIVGSIESFAAEDGDSFTAVISYATDTAGHELTQLLNVIFGNISIKPGIRVEEIDLPPSLLSNFKGPRFGREGLRKLLGIEKRPLLFTALKPMGLTAEELAALAYKFALGGIDLIKDDHGLANQFFSPFAERVKLCADAVKRANRETGYHCRYVANVTAPYHEIEERALLARELGAGGLLISPGLTGFDAMRAIAENNNIALPIFSHPAFQGSYVLSNHGLSHQVLFGQMVRLAGGDGTIFPSFGGRFSFSQTECAGIARGAGMPMGHVKPILPCPAGGMSLTSIPEALAVYGNEAVFLIGGGLFRHGPDIVENSRYFRQLIENLSSSLD